MGSDGYPEIHPGNTRWAGSKGLVPVNYHGPAEVDQLSHGNHL